MKKKKKREDKERRMEEGGHNVGTNLYCLSSKIEFTAYYYKFSNASPFPGFSTLPESTRIMFFRDGGKQVARTNQRKDDLPELNF